jgi:ABC-type glycerol-3-phosphate transport system substrate-binding protein
MVYRPSIVSEPPEDWAAVLEQKTPFVFPAADQQAVFSLAMYQALGVDLRDKEGRPHLETDTLAQVLAFYADAEQRGVMPFWLTQYQDDQEVWDAFLEQRADLIIAWLSDYLTTLPEDVEFSVLPVAQEDNFTLADGWVWSVASMQDEKRELAVELAKFLSENKFLDAYADSLGCITPYIGATESQPEQTQSSKIRQVALSARLIPSTDILNSLGLAVQQAVMQVLKNQAEPIPAAQSVIDTLTGP